MSGGAFIYGFLALTGEYIASERTSKRHLLTMTEMINAEAHHRSVAGHVATEDITLVTVRNHGLKQGPTYVKDFDIESSKMLDNMRILSLLLTMM